uniref:Unspecific monooxygenase n=1 Tax=Bursaphelenchus xylophilus TaxID=6326 RepID=A0A1I7RLX0_BURXY
MDTEDEFYRLKDCSKEATRAVGTATAGLVFMNPYLMKVPVLNAEARIGVDVTKEMISYFDRQVEKHLKENDYTQDLEPTDFLDAFLVEREKQVRSNGSEGHFSLNELSNVCFDIWSAGQETTSETITWTIAYLILYPEAQEKLQTELDTVIGSNRIIRNSDRPDLPYTNAVIMESQRCGNIVSQNIPRAVTEDITLDGFSYKKGTVVLPQISVLLQDPKIFPEPEKFNPDRFIDQNGKLRQVEELIPFSIGKRICLGEGLARMELFLFTANLFNQYKFSAGKVPPSLKKESGASSKIEDRDLRQNYCAFIEVTAINFNVFRQASRDVLSQQVAAALTFLKFDGAIFAQVAPSPRCLLAYVPFSPWCPLRLCALFDYVPSSAMCPLRLCALFASVPSSPMCPLRLGALFALVPSSPRCLFA